MSEYNPLLDIVRPFLNLKFNEIPEDIRARVKEADYFSLWDELTALQREQLVDQHDCEHDPESAKIINEVCNLFLKKEYLKAERTNLELMPARTPLERESKIGQLNELNRELEELELNHTQNNSKLRKIPQQETAILNALREKGYDPLNLPIPPKGKSGARKEVCDYLLPSGLFFSKKALENKWQELRDNKKIKDKK